MIERAGRPRLLFEALPPARIGRHLGGKNFQRYGAIETRIARAVDLAHAAGPQQRLHFIRAKLRAWGKHRWIS